MGVNIGDDKPPLPKSVSYLLDMHTEIRNLAPYDRLTTAGVIGYLEFSGVELNKSELGVVMKIDAILNRYIQNGNG